MQIEFLIIGHPRSGTGFAAKVLQAAGRDIGHERLGADGISSWMWATRRPVVPWGDGVPSDTLTAKHVAYIVRQPLELVNSVAFTERASEDYRRAFLPLMPADANAFERAVLSIVCWREIAAQSWPQAEFVALEDFVHWAEKRTGKLIQEPGRVNTRPHVSVDEAGLLSALRPDIRAHYHALSHSD